MLIVDDHEVLASSLAHVLDSEDGLTSVGIAGTIERAKSLLRTTSPDVVLLDHRLPDGDGVGAIGELRGDPARGPDRRAHRQRRRPGPGRRIEAGVSGFVSKTRSLGEVDLRRTRGRQRRGRDLPEMLARLLPRLHRRSATQHQELTERESEVLALLADGLTNAAIAERLFVSVHTVRNHIAEPVHQAGRALQARGALDRRARGAAARR